MTPSLAQELTKSFNRSQTKPSHSDSGVKHKSYSHADFAFARSTLQSVKGAAQCGHWEKTLSVLQNQVLKGGND